MKIDFRWDKGIPEVVSRVTGGEGAQLFLANEAKRLMDPYVPALNLALSKDVRVYTEGGKGVVHYQSPYARYQFEGKAMVSKHPGIKGSEKMVRQPEKQLEYTKYRHPLATSHWDQAMMAARKGDLVQAMQEYVEGRK